MHTLTKLRILSGALLVGGFAATQVLGGSDLWLALCVTTGGVGFAGEGDCGPRRPALPRRR